MAYLFDRPFLKEKKLKRFYRYLEVMADRSDDSPKSKQRDQLEQNKGPNPIPVLLSFLAGLSAFQLVLGG